MIPFAFSLPLSSDSPDTLNFDHKDGVKFHTSYKLEVQLKPKKVYNHKLKLTNPKFVTSRTFDVIKPGFLNAPAAVITGEDLFYDMKLR